MRNNVLTTILKAPVRIYKFCLSPFMGRNCRFYPSCSCYALEALDRHGALKGVFLSLRRVLRCHPYSRGPMIDPVPEIFYWKSQRGFDWAACFRYKRAGSGKSGIKEQ